MWRSDVRPSTPGANQTAAAAATNRANRQPAPPRRAAGFVRGPGVGDPGVGGGFGVRVGPRLGVGLGGVGRHGRVRGRGIL